MNIGRVSFNKWGTALQCGPRPAPKGPQGPLAWPRILGGPSCAKLPQGRRKHGISSQGGKEGEAALESFIIMCGGPNPSMPKY